MPPQTGTALVLLVAFVLPGFVTVLLQERTFKSAEDPTPFDRVLRTLYYSVWCYLLLAAVALIFNVDRPYVDHLYDRFKDDPAELVWRGALVILVPSFVVAHATRLWSDSRPQSWLRRKARLNERHEEPTAWDHFFRQRREAYVRVTTKEGGRVLGFYGPRSFAAYAKDGRDLWLERIYVADEENDWFGPEVEGNCGVWVRTDDVVSVEFYSPSHEREESPASAADEADAKRRESSPAPEGDGATT